ncbi:MAG TPA: class I SAM-dependent methyltransferase [Dongiaceae bacterium]|nr:class I SAM-dependent methyltransferase [Dongiaceae bacterium]
MQRLSFPLAVPIENSDGTQVIDFSDVEHWREVYVAKDPAKLRPIGLDGILDEDHHRTYGRPWVLGRYCFDYLVRQGLRPSDKVLDLGCGTGRVGVWLIRYLDPGNYFGIDSHLKSLVAFAGYEIVLHDLGSKKPRLMYNDQFAVDAFGTNFDLCFELSVVSRENVGYAYTKVAEMMKPGGRCFYLNQDWKFQGDQLKELGFRRMQTDTLHYPLFAASERDIIATDQWDVIERV